MCVASVALAIERSSARAGVDVNMVKTRPDENDNMVQRRNKKTTKAETKRERTKTRWWLVLSSAAALAADPLWAVDPTAGGRFELLWRLADKAKDKIKAKDKVMV